MIRASWLGVCLAVLLTSASANAAPDARSVGPDETRPAILFVALSVSDLDRALGFYTGVLGMKETQRFGADAGDPERPVEVVLRFGDDTSDAFLLLTHTPADTAPREIGNGFSRIAFTVPAVAPLVERVRQAGYAVTMAPKLIPEVGVEVALVTDPDGYIVELIEFKGARS